MIELLVQYIQDKGYICEVCPRMLIIRKYVSTPDSITSIKPLDATHRPARELVSTTWMISPVDLNYAYEHAMYQAADNKLKEIEDAICERFGVQA